MSRKRQSQTIPAKVIVGPGAICLITLLFPLLLNHRLHLVFSAGGFIKLLLRSNLRPGVTEVREMKKICYAL
jgi:hypothetical protein